MASIVECNDSFRQNNPAVENKSLTAFSYTELPQVQCRG